MLFEDPRQKVAIAGIVSGLLFSFSFILIAFLYFPFTLPAATTLPEKLLFAWQCVLFAAIPLSAAIATAVARKCLRPGTLDGEPVMDGSRLDIHQRFIRDTTHQLVLFSIVLVNLAALLEGDLLRLIPVMTTWFMIARMHYWFAYLISPPHRIFGATATIAPTLFFLLLLAAHTLGLV